MIRLLRCNPTLHYHAVHKGVTGWDSELPISSSRKFPISTNDIDCTTSPQKLMACNAMSNHKENRIRGIGVQIGLEDACAYEKLGFNPLAPNATAAQKQEAALHHVITTSRGISPVWRNLTKLRNIWGGRPDHTEGDSDRRRCEDRACVWYGWCYTEQCE
jgi:hypothetical protein